MPESSSPTSPNRLAEAGRFVSRPDGQPVEVLRDGHTLITRAADGTRQRWSLTGPPDTPQLQAAASGTEGDPPTLQLHLLAALEAAFTWQPQARRLDLPIASLPGLRLDALVDALLATGTLLKDKGDPLQAAPDLLWQQARLWLPVAASAPFALQYTLTDGRRHPRRPPKREGTVYQRFIPWLGQTFSFRSLDMAADLPRFHRWMNDSQVAAVWDEAGDLPRHRHYLETIAGDPHMASLIACIDGEPFAYFEVYWAKENRIAPFYDAGDHDRGWHVLVGEPAFRGKAWATAWLTSISHYLFLDDPRTQRVVGEPRADHAQQIRNLDRSGFAKVKTFDFPHKRAMLVSMLRERYFNERLWLPADDAAAGARR